jgi:hypothetical protein
VITGAQWTALGISGSPATNTWDASNGWSISTTAFTAPQLTILAGLPDFNTAGTDGPRPGAGSQPADQAALQALIDLRIAAALVGAQGANLGSSKRTTTATTSNTSTASTTPITGISITVVGKGKPVDVRFFASQGYHSVANTLVIPYLIVNGVALPATTGQSGVTQSTLTTSGPSVFFVASNIVLTDGVSYTFEVGLAGGAAGTTALFAATNSPMTLDVTAR